jgi:hypothetical protein
VDSLEPLLTVAEVSVAFAGFASIVTVVAGRRSWGEGNMIRFNLMIQMSLYSIAFSLLPFSLLYFDISEGKVWYVASTALGIFLGIVMCLSAPNFLRLIREKELNVFVSGFSYVLMIVGAIAQFSVTIGEVEADIGPYFLGLLCLLALSGLSFARLMGVSILPEVQEEGGDT